MYSPRPAPFELEPEPEPELGPELEPELEPNQPGEAVLDIDNTESHLEKLGVRYSLVPHR